MPLVRRPPSAAELARLEPLGGTSRRYRDPFNGNEFSARMVNTARMGGSYESRRAARDAAPIRGREAERLVGKLRHRKDNLDVLVRAYQNRMQEKTSRKLSKKDVFATKQFWKHLSNLSARRGSKRKLQALLWLGYITEDQYEDYLGEGA